MPMAGTKISRKEKRKNHANTAIVDLEKKMKSIDATIMTFLRDVEEQEGLYQDYLAQYKDERNRSPQKSPKLEFLASQVVAAKNNLNTTVAAYHDFQNLKLSLIEFYNGIKICYRYGWFKFINQVVTPAFLDTFTSERDSDLSTMVLIMKKAGARVKARIQRSKVAREEYRRIQQDNTDFSDIDTAINAESAIDQVEALLGDDMADIRSNEAVPDSRVIVDDTASQFDARPNTNRKNS